MKKLLLCVFCLIALLPAPAPALAYSQNLIVVRVVKEDVMLYKNPTAVRSEELFALAKGYFALATDHDELFYQITYQFSENGYVPVLGYLKKEDANVWTEPQPGLIYPDFTAKSLFNNTYIYESTENREILGALVKGQSVKCYGFLNREDEAFVYVKFGNLFGYVPCAQLEISEIAEHPLPLPKDEPDPDPNPGGKEPDPVKPKDDKLQILLILAIVIPSLVIIYVMLRPKKKRF